MRFKKGAKVEVLSKTEVPCGSWRCAEIICGNGHHYTIKYVGHRGACGVAIVERVSRKAVRPRPPVLEATENWNQGDVVEVFQNFSWKMATVLKVLGKKYILVRLLGSSLEFKVSNFDIRVRHSWQDDKWIVVGKGSSTYHNGKLDDRLTPRKNLISSAQVQMTTTKMPVPNDYCTDKKEMNVLESYLVSSKALKRGSCSQVNQHAEPPQKFRAIQREGIFRRIRVVNTSTHLKQAAGVVFPRDLRLRAEECLPASINSRKLGISEMEKERRKQTDAVGCSFAVNLESNGGNCFTCSVGSCSVNSSSNYNKLRCPLTAGPLGDIDGSLSDAESVCQMGYEEENCSLPTKEELAEEIHRLELHAYRCTIEALHASGPLSWEQEALMTNLRLSLHISNDEHLIEIRNLISSESSISIR